MAPVAAENKSTETTGHVNKVKPVVAPSNDLLQVPSGYPRAPLQLSGILDKFKHIELTPAIGRQYDEIQLRDLLHAPNADEYLRELAIISE